MESSTTRTETTASSSASAASSSTTTDHDDATHPNSASAQTGKDTTEANVGAGDKNENNNTIRDLLGPDANILSFFELIQKYLPPLDIIIPQLDDDNNDDNDNKTTTTLNHRHLLQKTLFVPLDSFPTRALAKIHSIRHDEPLASLVDNVVWSLVQRRERCKRNNAYTKNNSAAAEVAQVRRNANNLLAQCHVVPSEHYHFARSGSVAKRRVGGSSSAVVVQTATPMATSMRNMPAGVVMTHINSSVDYCKTSPLMKLLHRLLGNDILRVLLMHTSIFVPLLLPPPPTAQPQQPQSTTTSREAATKEDCFRGNYMQLTGPPIQAWSTAARSTTTSAETTERRRRRRKKKRKRQSASGQNDSNTDKKQKQHPHPTDDSSFKPISRRSLFYSNAFVPKVGLPMHHILNDSSSCRPEALLADMLNLPMTNHPKGNNKNKSSTKPRQRHRRHASKSWKRVHTAGIPLCKDILGRHKACDYARILEHYCPLPNFCRSRIKKRQRTAPTTSSTNSASSSSATASAASMCPPPPPSQPQQEQEEEVSSSTVSLAQVSAAHTPANHVVSCLSSILKRVFPLDFWGTPENFTRVLEQVDTFVKLRRNEQLESHARALVQGIRVTKIPWIWHHNHHDERAAAGDDDNQEEQGQQQAKKKKKVKQRNISRSDHQAAERLLFQALRWIFSDFIIPFLRSTFYVTESEFSGKRVLYYRKPVWSIFRSLSMKSLLPQQNDSNNTNHQYRELSPAEAAERLSRQEMGFSRLRLLPKSTGVRPIAMLGRSEAVQPYCSEPVGTQIGGAVEPLTVLGPDEEVYEMDCNDLLLLGNESQAAAIGNQDNTDTGPPRKRQRLADPAATATTDTTRGGRSSGSGLKRPPATNAVLNDAFSVLRHEYSKNQEAFGSGVYGLAYFYPRYRRFVAQLKPRLTSNTRIFFGSVDIHHCYDNIRQDHLLKIVDKILAEGDYVIQRYSTFRRDSQSAGRGGCVDGGKVIKRQQKKIGPPEEFDPFHVVSQELAQGARRTVFVDGVGCDAVNKDRLMKQLREHLTSNLIVTKGRFGERFLVQSTGIPQGSIMSSLLCNYYYGDVERRLLSDTVIDKRNSSRYKSNIKEPESLATASNQETDCSLLARMVDDFMFVSTDHGRLKDFLKTMSRGEPSLGVCVNKSKTQVSIDTATERDGDDGSSKRETFKSKGNSTYFPWCGMLFDTRTGEVRVDYSRFHDGKASDGVTVDRSVYRRDKNETTPFLTGVMQVFVRPRCIPILFDPFINSALVQKVNFYQLQVLTAVKMATYLRTSATMMRRSRSDSTNNAFLLSCIENDAIQYSIDLIQQRLSASSPSLSSGQGSIFRRSDNESAESTIRWLGWKAFGDVFGRLRAEFPDLSAAIIGKVSCIPANETTQTIGVRALREIQLGKLL